MPKRQTPAEPACNDKLGLAVWTARNLDPSNTGLQAGADHEKT